MATSVQIKEGGGGGKEKQWSIRWLSCAATPSTVLFLPLFWKMAAFYLEEFSLKIGLSRKGGEEGDPPELHQRTLGCTPLTSTCVNNSLLFLSFFSFASLSFSVHHLRNTLLLPISRIPFVSSQIFIANFCFIHFLKFDFKILSTIRSSPRSLSFRAKKYFRVILQIPIHHSNSFLTKNSLSCALHAKTFVTAMTHCFCFNIIWME